MITRILGQLTEKQLEHFIRNISHDGRMFAKTLLLDEESHVNKLDLEYQSKEHRKLAMMSVKTPEVQAVLDNCPKEWSGRVAGVKITASDETLKAVNDFLRTYRKKRQVIDTHLQSVQERSDLFFGVPISKYLRDYKVFKKLLMVKTLDNPEIVRGYIHEFLEAHNGKDPEYPFAENSNLTKLAENLNPVLFRKCRNDLQQCVVTSLSVDIVSMLETTLITARNIDKVFNETVWRETREILPIFHNQHLRYMFYFYSLYLVNVKTSTLPRNISQESIVAIIRKVDELCS